MSSGCGDVLSLSDLQTAKKHQTFEAEVITGKQGGVAGGADIDYATNQVTGQVQKTLPAVLRDAGFFPASFDFTTGGTLSATDRNKVVYDPVSMAWYSWAGALPKTIPAGTNPLLDANWKPQTDPKLRTDLASATGYTYVPSINRINSVVPVEQFRDGVRTDQQIVQAANDYAAINGLDLLFESARTYTVTTVNATCTWRGKGTIKRAASSGSNLITLASGSKLIGLTVDGTSASATGNPYAVVANAADNILVEGCTIFGNPGHVLAITNTPATDNPVRIRNNKISGTGSGASSIGSGIYLYNALNVDISGNEVTGKNDGILGQGNARKVARLIIDKNSVHHNLSGGITLALMTEAADQQAYDKAVISSNKVYGNGGTGIAVQSDLTSVYGNIVYANGSQTYHQGILVNANGVMVSNNVITDNAGVGIDFGDCRKCSATANHVENNGWIGIEVNSSEQMTVTGNVLNLNFRGKTGADLQAAILVHKGSGGYPFLGDTSSVTIMGNTIRGGDGQQFAILVADTNCYDITIIGNTCRTAGLVDDIVSRSQNVIVANNYTRWDPLGTARATVASGVVGVPSVADVVYVNGTGSVITINIQNSGAYVKNRILRVISVNGMTLENSGGTGGNLFLGASKVLAAGSSFMLWTDGSGGWKPAFT